MAAIAYVCAHAHVCASECECERMCVRVCICIGMCICRAGQNHAVYLIKSLQSVPFIHRINGSGQPYAFVYVYIHICVHLFELAILRVGQNRIYIYAAYDRAFDEICLQEIP